MATVAEELQNLTSSVDALVTAVNVSKDYIDAAAQDAQDATEASYQAQAARTDFFEQRELVTEAADQAVNAAEAAGVTKFYATKSAADTALSGLSDGTIVEVYQDEGHEGLRTRYEVVSGAYVFRAVIDITATKLKSVLTASTGSVRAQLRVAVTDLIAGYEDETIALMARMDVQPVSARREAINDLVAAVKDAGVWDKLDGLWLLAAHDDQAARRNWVADQFNLTAVNSPTFTEDQGFTGDGATSYLGSGLYSNTAGIKYAQDDAYMAAFVLSTLANDNMLDVGLGAGYINSNTFSAKYAVRANHNTSEGVSIPYTGLPNHLGYFSWSRSGPSSVYLAKDGTKLLDSTQVSGSIGSNQFTIGTNAAVPSNSSSRKIGAVAIGSHLTEAEDTALYTAIHAYMQIVGAVA